MSASIPADFTHLQVFSHYSLLAATAPVAQLAARAAADGLQHLALTDHNVLYGAVAFARACRRAELEPILGMTVSLAAPADSLPAETGPASELILLARNQDGYRSLCRLSSALQSDPDRGPSDRRRLSWETLQAYPDGLICLESGRDGWLARILQTGDRAAAGRYLSRLGGIFQERCYLGLTLPAGTPDSHEAALIDERLSLGRRFGMPPVALQPVRCLAPEDGPVLELLTAVARNSQLSTVLSNEVSTAVDTWLSPEEMAVRFAGYPDALASVSDVIKACGKALPDGRPVWPALDLPVGQSSDDALRTLAEQGLREQYPAEERDQARERLQRELTAIGRHGFAPLFLIVADIVGYARRADIPVSTRGSVANSLVAYCVGITTVDPLAHGLIFERFLNPARASLPDIDLDFCSRRRDQVLAYVRQRYGPDRVALVATVSTLQPKSAVRETGKAYGLGEAEISQLIRLLPRNWHPDPRRRSRQTVDDILGQVGEERLRRVLRDAYRIVGQPHHLSIHPGGIVITPGPLTDIVPVQWSPKGYLITQFDHGDVAEIGLPKIDLLGIRALTVLADASERVREHYDPQFRLTEIPADDVDTGLLLSQGETIGVFQCESAGAQRTLRQLQARTVRDLAVANAFFKPGPATGGMAQAFIRRYRGEEAIEFLHPSLAPILGPTQGVLLFQEQVLRVAREIAGLSWEQADYLRRGMSQFRADEMAALQTAFVIGCQRPAPEGPGFSEQAAATLWEQVMAFAGYGFNQGHATAYADVSYRSAYLKAHWPAAFLCARLAGKGGFHHQAIYLAEAVRLGFQVRPPHINRSRRRFTLSFEPDEEGRGGPVLWMGLGQVRSLRRRSVQAITAAQKEQPFAGLRDLLARVPLRSKEMAHLIQCGALDGLGESRAALLAESETIARAGNTRQMGFSFAVTTTIAAESPAQRLAWEQHLLGQPITVHPLSLVPRRTAQRTVPLRHLPEGGERLVTVLGVRLPGWSGGGDFFLGDGDSFVPVRLNGSAGNGKLPAAWLPLRLRGRWRQDAWGGGWFQTEALQLLSSV